MTLKEIGSFVLSDYSKNVYLGKRFYVEGED